MMSLPEKEEKIFWEELENYEKEDKMPYITSVERIGIQKGIQQGVQKGKLQLLASQISKRFSSKPENVIKRLQKLDSEKLTELGENIFDFQSLKEVQAWIKNASSTAVEA